MKRKSLFREKLYNVKKYIKHPEKFICHFCASRNYRYAWMIPDKLHIKSIYKKYMDRRLDLAHPVTFNEKLQWLKLYDRRPIYTVMADKTAVKEYIAENFGAEYIIPTLAVYHSVDEICYEDLPSRFVIKCTHDSGSTVICNRKEDLERAKQKLRPMLARNFFWYDREWPYKNIEPKIIAEEFLCDEQDNCPVDYKFFCFDGRMEFFKIDYNRFTHRAANYYDRDYRLQDFGKIHSTPDPSIQLELPGNMEDMIVLAERISKGIPFLRVDLYSIQGKVYFGECTFYPSGGIEPFIGDGDIILGKYLKLPNKKR